MRLMRRGVFSMFDMDDFLRSAGAERVDFGASEKLGEILEDSGKQLLFQARVLARHAGRSKITSDDVKLAAAMRSKKTN